MKFKLTITGSGTIEEIKQSLDNIIDNMFTFTGVDDDYVADYEEGGQVYEETWEDPTLLATIEHVDEEDEEGEE